MFDINTIRELSNTTGIKSIEDSINTLARIGERRTLVDIPVNSEDENMIVKHFEGKGFIVDKGFNYIKISW